VLLIVAALEQRTLGSLLGHIESLGDLVAAGHAS
jgi:hypothetical protein